MSMTHIVIIAVIAGFVLSAAHRAFFGQPKDDRGELMFPEDK